VCFVPHITHIEDENETQIPSSSSPMMRMAEIFELEQLGIKDDLNKKKKVRGKMIVFKT
jgi:hypothetical protein